MSIQENKFSKEEIISLLNAAEQQQKHNETLHRISLDIRRILMILEQKFKITRY